MLAELLANVLNRGLPRSPRARQLCASLAGKSVSIVVGEPGGELGRIWRIPRPVVYRAIGRLVEAGFITPASVEPGLGPQRTIYTVTVPGREAAEHWLSTPVEHVRDIRSHLLIKLALLHRAGRDPGGRPGRRVGGGTFFWPGQQNDQRRPTD